MGMLLAGRHRWRVGAFAVGALVSWVTLAGPTGAATTTTTTESTTTTLGCIDGPTIGYSGTSPILVGSTLQLTGARLNTDASGEAPCWGPYSGPVHLTLVVGARTVSLGDATATNGVFHASITIPAAAPTGDGGIDATWAAGGLGDLSVSVGVTIEAAVVPTTSGLPAPVPARPSFTG